MSVFDGSTEPLSYGEAILYLVTRPGLWATEEQAKAVELAVRTEHGLLPDPEPGPEIPTIKEARVQALTGASAFTDAELDAELERRRVAATVAGARDLGLVS